MSDGSILEFATRVLEREGALVERAAPGVVEALLPDKLQRALGSGELAVLTDRGNEAGLANAQPCGYGTEVLGKLVEAAVGGGRTASFQAELPESPLRSPEVLQGLNLSFRVARTWSEPVWTLIGFARYQATSDDERLGLVDAAVTGPEGVAVPSPDLALLPLAAISPEHSHSLPLEAMFPRLVASLRNETTRQLAGFREAVARRRQRDTERLKRYFDDVARDLKRRLQRRAGAPLEEKLQSLPAELQRRLSQLEADSVLSVRLDLVGLVAVHGPGLTAEIEVRRRKHLRILKVRYNGLARRWVGLCCNGCGAATLAFVMCDEATHVLCPACWDSCGAGGHRRCFRCEGKPERQPGELREPKNLAKR